MRSALRGLLALSDVSADEADSWGAPAEVMLSLKAELPQRRLRAALLEGDAEDLARLINTWIAEDKPLLDLARELRSFSHELGQMALAEKISAYRLYDTPDARLTFAGIIGDESYLEANLSGSPDTDGDIIGRARLGRLDWLEERMKTLGEPLGLETPIFRTGELSVDLVKRIVRLGEREIKLSPKEYDILRILVQYAGKVITHQHLLKQIWGGSTDVQYLRVYVRQLRQKIERVPDQPHYITTETGVGYRMREVDPS